MTLSEMASAVRNHVDGHIFNIFSLEQLQDEILLTTSAVIVNHLLRGYWILIN
jgi:hypothetical protein